MDHILIFANPIAGRGQGGRVARQLDKELRRRGYHVSMILSKADSQRWKGGEAVRAAIVIGGDGTLRGVAQWAIETARRVGGPCQPGVSPDACVPYPLLIVPMGTANLMGQHLGIKWDREHLADQVGLALARHRIVHLDVAQMADSVFLLMAGIGFDAWVIHELARIREGPINIADYIMPTVKAVAGYQFPILRVTVDGKRVFDDAPALAAVGNVAEYGTGFPLLPQARSDDQRLDICVLPCATRGELFTLALQMLAGEHVRQEGVVYVKGQHVKIESPEPVQVQIDGEPAGFTPVEMDLLEGRIPFMVPNGGG